MFDNGFKARSLQVAEKQPSGTKYIDKALKEYISAYENLVAWILEGQADEVLEICCKIHGKCDEPGGDSFC